MVRGMGRGLTVEFAAVAVAEVHPSLSSQFLDSVSPVVADFLIQGEALRDIGCGGASGQKSAQGRCVFDGDATCSCMSEPLCLDLTPWSLLDAHLLAPGEVERGGRHLPGAPTGP
jgi:hypothetical protein